MREAYKEYIQEHPEELRAVAEAIRHSRAIQEAIDTKIKERNAFLQKCREELYEARNKGR